MTGKILRLLLPRVERFKLKLMGPETRKHDRIELVDDWFWVSTHLVMYHDYLKAASSKARRPTLWLANHAGLHEVPQPTACKPDLSQ